MGSRFKYQIACTGQWQDLEEPVDTGQRELARGVAATMGHMGIKRELIENY